MSHLNKDKGDDTLKDKKPKKDFLIFEKKDSSSDEWDSSSDDSDSNLDKWDSSSDDLDSNLDDLDSSSDEWDSNLDELDSSSDEWDSNLDDLDSSLDELDFLDEDDEDKLVEEPLQETNNLDLRIITNNPKNGEILSTAISNIDLGEDFHIKISTIIPATDLNIASSTTKGADIILMASENEKDFSNFYESLKSEHNYVEFLKLSAYNDIKSLENQITNLIIKVGLNSIFKITQVNHIQNQFNQLNEEYLDILTENDSLKTINKKLTKDNDDLSSEINTLQTDLDDIKSDFSDFKARYSNIHMKNILEIFSLNELWMELFSEDLDYPEKIVIATNKFKPEDILVGQGYIGANSKEKAIDWLKVVKTAIIFVEHNEDDLKEEFKDVELKNSPESRYNNYSDDNETDDDYEIPNNFSNFLS